jgi:hypothetical protein
MAVTSISAESVEYSGNILKKAARSSHFALSNVGFAFSRAAYDVIERTSDRFPSKEC